MTALEHVAVVVPAADEEERIGRCLAALDVAITRLRTARPDVTTDVVVVLDRCVDDTAEMVAAAGVRSVRSVARVVGVARALGTRAALDGVSGHATSAVWLANTDADSAVAPQWLVDQVTLAEAGAQLVAGTVVPDATGTVLEQWRARHDAGDGHRHVHGANLGVRADVLARLGGWPALSTGEDVELVRRARGAGVAVARTGRSPVVTSARRRGRAPDGFADYLAALDPA